MIKLFAITRRENQRVTGSASPFPATELSAASDCTRISFISRQAASLLQEHRSWTLCAAGVTWGWTGFV